MTSQNISLGELETICRLAGRDIDRIIAPVVKETAYKVRKTQYAACPKRSGRTKRSIRATGPGGRWFTPTTVEAEVGPTWWVGRLLESGTVRMAPRPFVSTSYEPHRADHEKRLIDAVVYGALKGLTT